MNKAIYMLVKRGLPSYVQTPLFPDITIFKDDEGYWGIGEDPTCFEKWCSRYGQKIYKTLRYNNTIKFMSHIIYEQNDESWMCVKNRFTNAKSEPPFTSIEEARLVSVINGWPEPVLIYGRSSALYHMV